MNGTGYLHIGNDIIINPDQIVGIFDLDTSTIKTSTRHYLSTAQKNGEVVNVTLKLPKSFVVVKEKEKQKVYLSQLSTVTLLNRQKEGFL